MRNVIFQKEALAEYNKWKAEDKKISERIKRIIEEIQQFPFEGIGKP